MRDLFAVDSSTADRSYISVRYPTHEGARRARTNCDELWSEFESLASEHFVAEFPRHFHQRWFEMYLAVALLRSGLDVRSMDDGEPDLLIHTKSHKLWVEAIAPTGGDESNPDRVEHHEPAKEGEIPQAYRVPVNEVILRVRAALHDKAKKIALYRERGIIGPNDQTIIAINLYDIPHGFFDSERYGLGAVYGQGDPYIVIDRVSLKTVENGYARRSVINRRSGTSINMEPFLHPGHEHVSGALISAYDASNCEPPLGRDFMLLPNPNGAPTYEPGQIKLGREWILQNTATDTYSVNVIDHQLRRPET